MTEVKRHGSVGIVMDGPSGQRFADRLNRSGVMAYAISSRELAEEAHAGQFFLVPLILSASAEAVARQGAHVCLMPPWPAPPVTIGAASVSAAEVERRSSVCYAAAPDSSIPQDGTLRTLKILYRERLVGVHGTALAESETGDLLLAVLPRASNRHGYAMVTTLQLSVASAQTRLDDVARLIDMLSTWCVNHTEPAMHTALRDRDDADRGSLAEEYAPIVGLALSLTLTSANAAPVHGDTPRRYYASPLDRLHSNFDQVCHILGLAPDPAMFDAGWAWLEARKAVSIAERDVVVIDPEALERYSVLWQLGPRLRRLRRIDSATW